MTDQNLTGTQVTKMFAEHFILAEDESRIQIQSFWEKQTSLLVFVRHFG